MENWNIIWLFFWISLLFWFIYRFPNDEIKIKPETIKNSKNVLAGLLGFITFFAVTLVLGKLFKSVGLALLVEILLPIVIAIPFLIFYSKRNRKK